MTITPPSGVKASQLTVSPASAFHNPSATSTTVKQQLPRRQQQRQQETKEDTDPATLQRHSLLFLIFSYLDTRTLSRMSIVCREWRDISLHPSLWHKVVLVNNRISSKVNTGYMSTRGGERCMMIQQLRAYWGL
ncbi:hypothetical protein LSH36_276g02023 [Paralvinella palmiformis]|uniref:F-box domain-containing protein n=1 Tax=Paralvinella palmiformis TaxID=53620 RepID=A0AAD9JJA5_9ANNE|nr:hypothetical protein LSH36_276g02023 [Paralvinella palmiformis]